jgi:hypothetical protein
MAFHGRLIPITSSLFRKGDCYLLPYNIKGVRGTRKHLALIFDFSSRKYCYLTILKELEELGSTCFDFFYFYNIKGVRGTRKHALIFDFSSRKYWKENFFAKYKFLTYPHFFHKISTQSLIKDKKIKDERGKRIIYIKIIHRKLLLVPYILGNTIATIEGWLNIGNLT